MARLRSPLFTRHLLTHIAAIFAAVVIASASGKEFAYESNEWRNGVFTYALLEGLKSKSADRNSDGQITVSELKDYVTQRVQFLTSGKQTPTSRRENLDFDFRVW